VWILTSRFLNFTLSGKAVYRKTIDELRELKKYTNFHIIKEL